MTRRVLSAKPSSPLSGEYLLRTKDDDNIEVALVAMRTFRPDLIKIHQSPIDYQVHHESFFSKSWKLVENTAEKKELITARIYTLRQYRAVFSMSGETFKLYHRPPFRSREWILRNSEDEDLGMVRLDSWLSGVSTVSFNDNVPIQLQIFCFWFVTFVQRQQGAAAAGGAC